MNNVMPNPISPMGRAVQAKTEGMTPDQVAALDQQYAEMGIAPIGHAITLWEVLNRLKRSGQQQQAGSPSQTTVVQDLQQQLGGGIATLPSNVGNETAYARGGIVAFGGAGLVPNFEAAKEGLLELATNNPQMNPQRQAIQQTLHAAEKAAASVPPAARKALLTRMLGGVFMFAKNNPWILAASIGLPIVASFLSGDEEESVVPQQAAPEEDLGPPVDLTGILDEARQSGMSGGIASLGVGKGMPDVRGSFAPLIKSAEKNLAENPLQPRPEIEQTMGNRYAGLTGHIDAREAALQEQQNRLEENNKARFGQLLANFGFGMAKESSEDGATILGAAGSSAFDTLKERERLMDKYEAEKNRIADNLFGMGEARATHKRGIITAADTEENAQRARRDAADARLFEVQARMAEQLISAYDKMLDRTSMEAIATARNKGLTGLDMLQEAAAIAGMKHGKNSREYLQVSALMEDVANRSVPAALSARLRERGDDLFGLPTEGTGRVISARPAGQ